MNESFLHLYVNGYIRLYAHCVCEVDNLHHDLVIDSN